MKNNAIRKCEQKIHNTHTWKISLIAETNQKMHEFLPSSSALFQIFLSPSSALIPKIFSPLPLLFFPYFDSKPFLSVSPAWPSPTTRMASHALSQLSMRPVSWVGRSLSSHFHKCNGKGKMATLPGPLTSKGVYKYAPLR